MNCEQARDCVDAYISHTLPEKKQEEFIKHVKVCPECFQELETYFIVDVAIQYFDNRKDDTYDIRNLLQEDLDKRLMKRQNRNWIIMISITVTIVLAIIVAGLFTNWFGLVN